VHKRNIRKKIESKSDCLGRLLETSKMTSNMNINDFQAKVMAELAEIKNLLANAGPTTTVTKEKKARKPRDPDAPPNPWIVFTGRVRAALKSAGKPAGKECQQFASYLKTEFKEEAYNMEESEILAAHADWTPPPPKPKEDKDEEPAKSEAEEKPKPKRVLSEEQKAKMAAGRKAAAERRKAEKEAADASKDEEASSPAVTIPPPKPAAAAAPAAKPKPALNLKPLPFKGKKMLWDPENNGCWLNDNGVKGAWQGVLTGSGKDRTLDTSAKDYTA
jgi:hypothetical protein